MSVDYSYCDWCQGLIRPDEFRVTVIKQSGLVERPYHPWCYEDALRVAEIVVDIIHECVSQVPVIG